MSSRYRDRNFCAPCTGVHVRRCLWHQYGADLRRTREVEVEVGRQAGGARGPREDDAEHVCVRVLLEQRAEVQELGGGLGREPLARVAARPQGRAAEPRPSVGHLLLEQREVVRPRLHAHEQSVEGSDVDPDRVVARFERLHERRARAGEGIEDAPSRSHVALEQRLDELRDELAEVGVESVNVLRPLALGELARSDRSRAREVDVASFL